jgi:hypothetical protein
MRLSLLQALMWVSGLVGCSSSAFRTAFDPARERLDVLTSYSLALSKRDYREAAKFLAPADRVRIASPDQGILPEYRERVRAIRRTTLMNNPLIEIRHGLIHGIPDILPVLELGRADSSAQESETGFAQQSNPEPLRDSTAREDLHRTARAFFKAVSHREWRKALGYVDAQEKEGFLDSKGGVRDAARSRLASADTSGWEALTLKDGKLTGIVLLLPDKATARSD